MPAHNRTLSAAKSTFMSTTTVGLLRIVRMEWLNVRL